MPRHDQAASTTSTTVGHSEPFCAGLSIQSFSTGKRAHLLRRLGMPGGTRTAAPDSSGPRQGRNSSLARL